MAPKFGTSGLRGLVSDLTDDLVWGYVAAFLRACPTGRGLYLGRDLRASSPAIAATVAAAAASQGVAVTDCGALPTPALALAAMSDAAAAVMVTGSHIPDDRNGLKFYTPAGEITKADEAAILGALEIRVGAAPAATAPPDDGGRAATAYRARYTGAFGPAALRGMRIGAYTHSAVGRDLLIAILRSLGATVTELGRSERFVPVDTEAVDAETRERLVAWAGSDELDAIVSTDGDGDRPLVADAAGRVIPGDVLGQITAAALGAETVVTPVSSNSGVAVPGRFTRVLRTRIGSPHVIAGMQAAGGRVAGYEANGGFLLGFEAAGPAGPLPALVTRDALLPIVVPLMLARGQPGGLAALVAAEPARFTAADRLAEVSNEASGALLARLDVGPAARADFLTPLGAAEATVDRTDGLRIALTDGRILHLRPSGNAPELRLYVEAESTAAAEALLAAGLSRVAELLRR